MSDTDRFFESLAQTEPREASAPPRLKSRIFSKLMSLEAAEGPLMSLSECKSHGANLCVFEQLVAIAPIGEDLKSKNPCNVCHARVLGERMDSAPIYWPGCPYVRFQKS